MNKVWREWGVGPGVAKTTTYIVGGDGGGTYYFWVGEPIGQDSYTFEITVASQTDGGSDGDAGDEFQDAVDVEPDVELAGLLGDDDQNDFYRFDPEEGQTIIFTPASDSEDLGVELLDADQESYWLEYSVTPGKSIEYEIEVVEGATPYYIRVIEGRGTYTIRIEPAP
jgi:hypothetical protein